MLSKLKTPIISSLVVTGASLLAKFTIFKTPDNNTTNQQPSIKNTPKNRLGLGLERIYMRR